MSAGHEGMEPYFSNVSILDKNAIELLLVVKEEEAEPTCWLSDTQ